MTSASEVPPAPPFAQPPKSKRTLKIVLIVVGALVSLLIVFIVAVVLLVNSSTEEAETVSDQLIEAVQQGDGAAAYALTGPSFRAVSTEDQLTELVEGLSTAVTKAKRSSDGKGISVSTETGRIAVFTYTLEGADGSPVYVKTQLREEDGQWRVMNFRSSATALNTDVE